MNSSTQSSGSAIRHYVLVEALIAITIAVPLSMAFAWLFFRGHPDITLRSPELVRDTAVQGFIVPFWIVLPITIVGRRRRRTGSAPRSGPWGRWPANAFIRALLFGVLVGVILGALHRISATSLPSGVLSMQGLLAFKGAVGASIAIFIAPLAARASLADGAPLFP